MRLKQSGLYFISIYNVLNYPITPFLLQHVSYIIKYSTRLKHCHLILVKLSFDLLFLHSIAGLKYIYLRILQQ